MELSKMTSECKGCGDSISLSRTQDPLGHTFIGDMAHATKDETYDIKATIDTNVEICMKCVLAVLKKWVNQLDPEEMEIDGEDKHGN